MERQEQKGKRGIRQKSFLHQLNQTRKSVKTTLMYLMCPTDEVEVVLVKELGDDLGPEGETHTAVVLSPTHRVLKIKILDRDGETLWSSIPPSLRVLKKDRDIIDSNMCRL